MRAHANCYVVMLLALAGCDDGSLQRVQSAPALRVGYAVEAAYALLDARVEVSGESAEVARRLASTLGMQRVEWVQAGFDCLIPDLLDRRFDVIAAGLFVTPERAARVRFSRPTLHVGQGLLVLRGNPRRVQPFAELSPRTAAKIAVIAGAVEETRLRARGLAAASLVIVPDALAGRAAVAQGHADAFALSLPTVRWMATQMPEQFEVVAQPESERRDAVAFAFHPQDASLAQAWDAAEARFVGSPEHLAILARFEFDPADVSGEAASP